MATRVFLCPNTGGRVQGWFADNGSDDGETYEATQNKKMRAFDDEVAPLYDMGFCSMRMAS
jgi:hypothetical protein